MVGYLDAIARESNIPIEILNLKPPPSDRIFAERLLLGSHSGDKGEAAN